MIAEVVEERVKDGIFATGSAVALAVTRVVITALALVSESGTMEFAERSMLGVGSAATGGLSLDLLDVSWEVLHPRESSTSIAPSEPLASERSGGLGGVEVSVKESPVAFVLLSPGIARNDRAAEAGTGSAAVNSPLLAL